MMGGGTLFCLLRRLRAVALTLPLRQSIQAGLEEGEEKGQVTESPLPSTPSMDATTCSRTVPSMRVS